MRTYTGMQETMKYFILHEYMCLNVYRRTYTRVHAEWQRTYVKKLAVTVSQS